MWYTEYIKSLLHHRLRLAMKAIIIFALALHRQVQALTSNNCADGQVFYDDECVCLSFQDEPQKFYENARNWCRSQGGDLVSISSSKKKAFVEDLIPNSFSKNGIWIGLKYQPSSSGFYWSANNKRLQYANWGLTEPDIALAQECVLMHRTSTPAWGWKNYWCTVNYYSFICQFDAVCAERDGQSGFSSTVLIGIIAGSIFGFIIFMAVIFLLINCVRRAMDERKNRGHANAAVPIPLSVVENRCGNEPLTVDMPERTELLEDDLPPPYSSVVHTKADVEYNDLDRANVNRHSSRLANANVNGSQGQSSGRSTNAELNNMNQPSSIKPQRSESIRSEEDNVLEDNH